MTWFDPKFHWTFCYKVIRDTECICSICLYYVKLIFFFNTKIWSICWENRKCSKYIQRVETLHSLAVSCGICIFISMFVLQTKWISDGGFEKGQTQHEVISFKNRFLFLINYYQIQSSVDWGYKTDWSYYNPQVKWKTEIISLFNMVLH